ncbi:hypothetical protein F7734_54475 [Scytonema sp. UIC 10036]|uniref:hypothetical protein n=1 Tax=Scytonema sp. UIC 10036 TaxID=2304196 RepID=UPI0012DAAFB3|nr:hypothetical protein [Scytonema sp. UIC 10036]MUH00805.1 hypothetical protein [Scytonema sp. UIC 10036]
MKCINCGTDNNLKDRTGNQGRCVKCQHPFVFEPTSMGNIKMTDPLFAKAIADISANNTLFFTPNQLFYLLDNRLKKKLFSTIGWGCVYLFFNIWVTVFFGVFSGFIIGDNSFLIVNLIYQVCVIYYLFTNTNSNKLNHASRQASAKALQRLGILILVVGILVSWFVFSSFPLFVIVVILGMLSIYLGTRQLGRVELVEEESLFSQSQFQDWLNHWQNINGPILKILNSPREQITPASINPDVTAYSFDRLVVCDSAAIAQLLIANHFHFENNCAILSITGYPESIFDTTMQMLRRNSELKVYALHDCTPQGVGLVHHLGTSANWFRDSNIAIIDVGLLPRQIIATKQKIFIQTSSGSAQVAKQLAGEIRQSLSAEELAWLESGKFVKLESFSPQRLIKILQRSIAGSYTLEEEQGNDIYIVQSFG